MSCYIDPQNHGNTEKNNRTGAEKSQTHGSEIGPVYAIFLVSCSERIRRIWALAFSD